MEKKNVILAMEPSFYCELIKDELRRSNAINLVAEVRSPLELLHSAQLHEAVAVIMESDDVSEMPGILTHLFAEFPRMLAIVFDSVHNRATVYRPQIHRQVLDQPSLGDILDELGNADTQYWMRA